MPGGPYLWQLRHTAKQGDVPVYDAATGRFRPEPGGATLTIRTFTFADSPVDIDDLTVVYLIDATDGPVIVNVPTAVGRQGALRYVKKIDITNNEVTLTPTGAEEIDRASTKELTNPNTDVPIISDNANWWIL